MRRRIAFIAVILTVAAVPIAAGSSTAAADRWADRPPKLRHLDPGGQPSLGEKVPVNVVFVGYEREDVDARQFRAGLPSTYDPVVRSRSWYGATETLGISSGYDYDVTYADRRYEDAFFATLGRLATAKPTTVFQDDYSAQDGVLDITDNAWIDAPSVERWLAYHAPRGVDTRENTIYLVNWWGRDDFRHHVYTKTDEVEPDTGYNFGLERDSRKMVAWGGTTAADEENGLGSTRRVWFHDLSAGPEAFAGSYDVTNADLDGDGVPDYRFPPIWEYADDGYRAPGALTDDLAKLTRYVALDLLMTTSPIYPVELPTSEPPTSINLDSNTYEGWEGVDASDTLIKPDLLTSELSELMLGNKQLSYDNQDLPFGPGDLSTTCYDGWLAGVDCEPSDDLPAFANLFVQNLRELARTQDDAGTVDYELPMFNYAVDTNDPTPLGFADDNWVDGTQSFVFSFISPFLVDAGYGLTTTQIHEVGHHVALSHPHDGYDSESGTEISPSGDFYFAWHGDAVNSMMSYIDLNWDFSQFDQDNMARFQAAAYIEAANRLAAEALAAPKAERAYDELRRADRRVAWAEKAFARHRYDRAWSHAGDAYALAAEGAAEAGVDVEASVAEALSEARQGRAVPSDAPEGATIDTLEPDGPRLLP